MENTNDPSKPSKFEHLDIEKFTKSIHAIGTRNGKLSCHICMRHGEFTPFIRFGSNPEDTFGWVINKIYDTNKLTIPHELVTSNTDIRISDKILLDSYICPSKYILDVRWPYYRGNKYTVIMQTDIYPEDIVRIATHGYTTPIYAHGIHDNCNTIFMDAISPHISWYDKITLSRLILQSHWSHLKDKGSN